MGVLRFDLAGMTAMAPRSFSVARKSLLFECLVSGGARSGFLPAAIFAISSGGAANAGGSRL
jgi:hypothetical protein